MKVEDFAAWLSAISGMSEDQRREAMVALEKASVVKGAAAASAKKGGKRGRQEDALGTTGVERVAAQGCPHCAGREIVGWGRSHGLLRFRCKSCGRTFNTLTRDADGASAQEGPLARSRVRAMIEGKSPGEDRGALRNPSDDGVSLASSASARPCKRQAPGLERNRLKRTKPSFSNPSRGPTVRPAEKGAKARRNGQASWPSPGQHSHPCRPRPERRHLRRDLGPGRRRFGEPRLRRNRAITPLRQSSHRRWRQGDRHFRPSSRDCLPLRPVPSPGKPSSRESASPPHQQRQRLSRPP